MTLLYILLALFFALIVFFAIDRDGFWQRMAGNPDMGQTDFRTLKPATKPNEALACPADNIADICPLRKPDVETGTYALSAQELGRKIVEIMTSFPLVLRIDDASNPNQLRFLRRTPIMRYPDTFSIELIELTKGRSTLSIHGKAQLGKTDMGNNLNLIRQLLKALATYKV